MEGDTKHGSENYILKNAKSAVAAMLLFRKIFIPCIMNGFSLLRSTVVHFLRLCRQLNIMSSLAHYEF